MLHEVAIDTGPDPAFVFKKKLGVIMFTIYAVIYAAFIAINVIKPVLMETAIFAGLNLAVVYGFGLILVALVMALFYSTACGKRERLLEAQGKA